MRISSKGSHGVMVSTLDFESSDPSSNLGGTFIHKIFFVPLKGNWEKMTLLKPRVVAPALYKHRQHPSHYYTLRFPRLKLILKRRKESHQDISSTFYIKQRDGIKGLLGGGGIEEIMCTLCILYCRHSTDLIINSKARIPV